MKNLCKPIKDVFEDKVEKVVVLDMKEDTMKTYRLRNNNATSHMSTKKIMKSNANNGANEEGRKKPGFGFLMHHIKMIFAFSLPRPPELTDLEDKDVEQNQAPSSPRDAEDIAITLGQPKDCWYGWNWRVTAGGFHMRVVHFPGRNFTWCHCDQWCYEGPEVGVSIGLCFFLGTAVAGALYVLGAVETFLGALPETVTQVNGTTIGPVSSPSLHDLQVYGIVVTIPVGTLAATLTTTGLYLISVLFFGAVATRTKLLTDRYLTATIAWPFPAIIYIGIILSTLGAALQSLTGAPCLFAAIANDDILPVLNYFKVADGSEPYLATLFTAFICISCVVIGNLDLISPTITMFFLLC
ncbi:hypothetical protein QQ045_031632 [Rhodiola kirilowii]